MSKVAGLAVVSVICFTSSAFVALFTDIPMLYHWHPQPVNGVSTSLLLILYYFIGPGGFLENCFHRWNSPLTVVGLGSSVPSAFVLWVMRELPPSITTVIYVESRPVTFISDSSESVKHPQRWSTATSSQNQIIKWESQEVFSDSSFLTADIKSKSHIIGIDFSRCQIQKAKDGIAEQTGQSEYSCKVAGACFLTFRHVYSGKPLVDSAFDVPVIVNH
ncbi:hypothetical protein CK203_080840 [Vitis vinifera]|uniref:Uncharacterized protein n=1 Tax=Vitis vinifera TaxID=29760 RepID=A0A438C0D1_VITVI|nr:hypothetical protein CK203_080840 [Vitis vinifera]